MSEKTGQIHSVSALFKTADEIMHAAEKVRDSEYEKFDVHTPYPVHGMDHAMGLSGTKVPFFTLVLALTGLTVATTLQGGIMASDYLLNIGGKPFFSLPAFMPIMFELSILFAAHGSVFFLITMFCNLPYNNNPLHDTDYMSAVMCDKFGITIESKDPAFDEAKVNEFLSKIGGYNVETIYYRDGTE